MAGFGPVCKYLIEADCKVAPQNKEGKKPSEYAESEEIVAMFAEEESKKKKKKQVLLSANPRIRNNAPQMCVPTRLPLLSQIMCSHETPSPSS